MSTREANFITLNELIKDVGSDVVEFILAGADLVQIGTLNYKNPNIGVEIVEDLTKYCRKNKIDNISDLKGQLNSHDN